MEDFSQTNARETIRSHSCSTTKNVVISRAAGLGNALSVLGRSSEARDAFAMATQCVLFPTTYAGLGDVFVKLKQYHEAVVAYEKAIELNPTVTLNYDGFISSLQPLGREEEAEQVRIRAKQLGYEDEE